MQNQDKFNVYRSSPAVCRHALSVIALGHVTVDGLLFRIRPELCPRGNATMTTRNGVFSVHHLYVLICACECICVSVHVCAFSCTKVCKGLPRLRFQISFGSDNKYYSLLPCCLFSTRFWYPSINKIIFIHNLSFRQSFAMCLLSMFISQWQWKCNLSVSTNVEMPVSE